MSGSQHLPSFLLHISLLLCFSATRVASIVCPPVITVAWKSHPPFAFSSITSSHPMGSVADPLQHMLDVCCGQDIRVHYEDVTLQYKPLLTWNATLVMPITRDPIQVSAYMNVDSRKFIPTQLGGGSVYVSFPDESIKSNVLLSVFTDGWPFLLLMLLVAAYGALFIWLFDFYWNPRQFPAFCLRGIWEGLWWAVISMTTVGYGDRIPCCCLARVVGFLVIVIGLVLSSLFTAAVTNAVSHVDFPDLTDVKVGVLSDSVEYALAITQNAKVKEFTSMHSLFAELFARNISGAFLDTYTWRFYCMYSVSSKDLDHILNLEQYPYDNIRVYHGFVARSISHDLAQCLSTVSIDEEMVRLKQFSEGWTMFEGVQRNLASAAMRRVLPVSRSVAVTAGVAAGAWLVLCAVIIAVQCVYYKKNDYSIRSLIFDCYKSTPMSKEKMENLFPIPEPMKKINNRSVSRADSHLETNFNTGNKPNGYNNYMRNNNLRQDVSTHNLSQYV